MHNSTITYPIWSSENFRFVFSFLFTVVLVYFFPKLGVPQIVIRTVFLLLLVVIFNTRDDVFWLSLFFLIVNSPGRMFLSSSSMTVYRLPFYPIIPGVSLGFQELFLLVYIAKTIKQKIAGRRLFSVYFEVILIYSMFLFLYSIIIGMTPANVIYSIRIIIRCSWALIIPALISDTDKIDRAFRMLFPFVFVYFAMVIFTQITGNYLHAALTGENTLHLIGEADEDLMRVTQSMPVVFICGMQSLFYLYSGNKRFNASYLTLILVTAITIIVLSATRGWIIGMLVLLFSTFFMGGFGLPKQLFRIAVFFGLFFIIVGTMYPNLLFQTSKAFDRVMTLEALPKET